ncbi:MAG TPA: GNAT family protein [Sphingobacteriaceae bacterium]
MFPQLYTPRFVLREIADTDHQQVFEGLSHPDVIRYYGVSYQTLDAARVQMDWFAHLREKELGIWWAIAEKNNQSRLIGACGFNQWKKEHNSIETGYWLIPEHWNNGVMTECLPQIITYAFIAMNIHRIEAQVETENKNSSRLLTKLGFLYEGTLRDCEIKDGRYISLEYYSLLNTPAEFDPASFKTKQTSDG